MCHLDKEGFLVCIETEFPDLRPVCIMYSIRLFSIFLTTKLVVNAGGSRFQSSITGTPFFNSNLWGLVLAGQSYSKIRVGKMVF